MGLLDIKRELSPSKPLTITDEFSIDDLIYLFKLSIFHPMYTWVYSCMLYWITSSTRWLICSALVVLLWELNNLNTNHKRRKGKAFPFSNKSKQGLNVLITGGCQGLGFEIVKLFYQERYKKSSEFYGCKVYIVDIIDLPADFQDIEGLIHLKCDLSDEEQTETMLITLKDKCEGKVDVIIANAALVNSPERFEDLSDKDIAKIWGVNVFSNFKLIRFVLKLRNEEMKSEGTKSRVHIVSIASILGFISPCKLSIYSSTKASQIALMDNLAHENPSNGVLVSCLCPGQLTSPMFENVHVPKRFLAPLVDHRKLAYKVLDIVKQGESGLFLFPFYAHFVPLLKSLPTFIYEWLRKYTEMDEQYH